MSKRIRYSDETIGEIKLAPDLLAACILDRNIVGHPARAYRVRAVSPVMKSNKSPIPVNVGVPRSMAIVLETNSLPDDLPQYPLF
jgi:hypothetical protein